MTTIYTRATKGSALTWTEGDANVTNLNNDKIEDIVEDTTPQLGGNLDVNGNSIVSVSNGNIAIAPNGTGHVHIVADALRLGDLNAEARISTYGTGNLVLTTNEGNDPDPTITIGNGANANITLAPSGTGTVIISGNLQVDGTTTTVNSTTVTVDDPIITLGGDTAPASDDNKDRGIEFRWHNGTSAKVGFFGYDDSTGYLTFIPDATNTSEVFTGTQGDIQATNFRGALVGNASTATTATTATGATNVNISTTDGNTSDTTMYPVFVSALSTGNQLPHIDSGILYDASTNALTATTFVGALTGNATTATTATTATNVTIVATGSDTTMYPVVVGALSGSQIPNADIDLKWDSSANILALPVINATEYREVATALTYASTITPNATAGNIRTITLTGNLTFSAFTTPLSGQTITLIITQDATGGRTLTSTFLFAGGSKTLSTAANAVDILTVSYIGTTYYASLAKAFA